MLIFILVLSFIISLIIIYFNYLPIDFNILWALPLWFVIAFVSFVLLIALMMIIYPLLINPQDKKGKKSKFMRYVNVQIARSINLFFGLRIKKYNLDLLPKDSKYLIVSNHQSNFDPLVLIDVLNNPDLIMLMKDNILKVPFIGRWLVKAGFLPLNRNNNREGLKTILEANHWVQDGYTLGAYPEGTRSRTNDLLPFKNGIFKVALKSQCPIIVCTSDGMYKVKKNFPLLPTKIYFKVSKVISYEEIKDLNTNEIGDMVRAIMENELKKAREEIPWLKKKTRVD